LSPWQWSQPHERGAKVEFLQNIDLGTVAIELAVLLFSLSLHEASHAWMADRFGDYTARYLGRVSLNPIAHIDPIGTILFPLLQFFTNLPLIGWAKPVPINSAHLKNPSRDQIFISLAGPGSNLAAAILAFLLLAALKFLSPQANGYLISMAVNMHVPHQQSFLAPVIGILFFALIINLALALFNLIPIPPLDGHWILYGLLPYNASKVLEQFGSYGFILLYALMFLGIFRFIFIPVEWTLMFLISI
jgi:Zn-dependent protease